MAIDYTDMEELDALVDKTPSIFDIRHEPYEDESEDADDEAPDDFCLEDIYEGIGITDDGNAVTTAKNPGNAQFNHSENIYHDSIEDRMKAEKPVRRQQPSGGRIMSDSMLTLYAMAREATECGMSYGKYVAALEQGTIRRRKS